MKISVDRLFHPDVEAIEVDQTIRLPGELGERYPSGVRVVGRITPISHGVHMAGSMTGIESETCARCLEAFSRDANIAVEETYSEDVRASDALFSDVAPLVDRSIDLTDLASQLLEVDEPMAAICSDSCLGICPSCGANKNQSPCACEEHIVDERLAGLAILRDELAAHERMNRR